MVIKNKKYIILLHILLLVYSISGVCSKAASGEEFPSVRFCLFYGGLVMILGVYAIFWQQIIKNLPLTFAYANKAVGILWTMLWGVLIFHESLKWNNIVGALIVFAGILLFTTEDQHE